MIYFDAAYVAKCYLNEPGADRVRELAYGADGLASCEIYTNDRHMLKAARHFHLNDVTVLAPTAEELNAAKVGGRGSE